MRRNRSILALLMGALITFGELAVIPTAHAAEQVRDGKTEATAAASCWEIKQKHPDSPDGAYWLFTPQMSAPAQFFCDQTMDGGGWVMIGRGRESWDRYPDGKGDPKAMHSRNRQPQDFGTVQLPNATINGLLGGTHVNKLPDGFRVLRAKNASGTDMQKFDIRPRKMRDWVWALSSRDRASYRIDNGGWAESGFMESGFGADTAWNRMELSTGPAKKFNIGFGYGGGAGGGDTSAGNYLWSANGSAPLPYAEVYVRPELSSDDKELFKPIADSGTEPIVSRAMASNFASKTSWGVTGNLNGQTGERNAPVQAFAEIGDTIFIGGNYLNAEQRSTGRVVPHKALAAFDKTTGNLIEEFNVEFDNQVKALEPLPNGKLLVGGDFKKVNGEPHSGTVLLDPKTGAIDPSWNLNITSRLAAGIVSVTAFSLTDQHIYIGGNFTHMQGANSKVVYTRAAGRVNLDGTPDPTWNPEFNGTVMDIDTSPAGDKFYAAGFFTKSAGRTAIKAAILSTEPGANPIGDWVFKGSASERGNYQQTIDDTGKLLFIGGSEHSLFGYDRDGLQRVSGSITIPIGGDMQATATDGDVAYAGCHCSANSYENAYLWPSPAEDWSRVDSIRWLGAWDAATGKQIGEFSPYMLRSRNAGAWGLFVASDGALWVGGDFTASNTSMDKSQWNSGWVRYPAKDSEAPATPGRLLATKSTDKSIDLRWDGVEDAASYDILRDDRVIANTKDTNISVPRGGDNRFFVRAADEAGNRSASTPVFVAPDANEVDPNSPVLIDEKATWQYSYDRGDAAEGWNNTGFDRADWEEGTAPIGYGANDLGTTITPPESSKRPITTWFSHNFTVADPKVFNKATLDFIADDGAVVYVNGKEVNRTRMPEGTIRPDTRAHQQISAKNAAKERVRVEIPSSMLVAGENVVAVETHINHKGSSSMTFDAKLEVTDTNPAPEVPEQSGDDALVAAGSEWQYWYNQEEPTSGWESDADVSTWDVGAAPIGFGDSGVKTDINADPNERPRTAYFVKDLDLDPAELPADAKLVIKVRADDGVLLRLNGEEVGRKRLAPGAVSHNTYADQAINTAKAQSDPLVVEIPVSELTAGSNRISAESHLNYRNTPSMTFDLEATVVS